MSNSSDTEKSYESNTVLFGGKFEMNKHKLMDEYTLISKATNILIDQLGSVEAVRFLSMPNKKWKIPKNLWSHNITFLLYI